MSLRICSLLLMGVVGFLAGQSHAQQPRAAGRSADSLVVMSFNMWHKDRPKELKVLADTLKADPRRLPDFILCQEVVFERDGAQENTAAVLASQLGYHARGTRRTSDKEGIAIISRFPFVYYDQLHLKAQTSRLLLGFNRLSVMGEFMVPGVGRVRVVDVHLTNWGFEKHIRRKQLAETLQWIAQRDAQVPAALTFLGGDFNAKPESKEMQLIKDSQFTGHLRYQNFNSDHPSMGLPGTPDKRIDYIFVASRHPVLRLARESLLWHEGLFDGDSRFYLSDHLCLLHEYSIDRTAEAALVP